MGDVTNIRTLQLRSEVVRVARKNIGYGEVEGNNDGPLLRVIGGKPGHEWCALFAGYCYRRAYFNLWGSTDRDDWTWRTEIQPVIGAKELVKAAWGAGALRFTDPHHARPGDLICWHRRTGPISWKGHVGIVEEIKDGLVHTIEGNVGKFPAKVRRLVRDVQKDSRFYGFAGFR